LLFICIAKIYTPEHDGSLYEVDDFGEGSYIQWKILFYQPWFWNSSLGSGNQLMRNSLLETFGQDYIRTARAKGLSEYQN
jgi:peptide/nickel transport system permease protein